LSTCVSTSMSLQLVGAGESLLTMRPVTRERFVTCVSTEIIHPNSEQATLKKPIYRRCALK
jgi:hypothetical protein